MADDVSEKRELAKQLNTYADGITAFAVVQGVGFAFVIAQSVTADCSVQARWYGVVFFAFIVSGVYELMVRRCHGAEDRLIGVPVQRGEEIAGVVPMIRNWRVWVIRVMALGEIALSLVLRFATPVFSCSSLKPQ